MTRRDWHRMAFAATAAAMLPSGELVARAGSNAGRVIGINTFSYRDRSRNAALEAMRQLGVHGCELYYTHVCLLENQPPPKHWLRMLLEDADKMREWRLSAPRSHFDAIRAQFERAGIEIYLYRSGVPDDCTDAELEREFQFASWMNAGAFSTQLELNAVPRFAAAAERHGMKLALHNTSSLFRRVQDTPALATQVEAQLAVSPAVCLSLDLGHFFAAGNDPITFIRKNHRRIHNIQLKDRKKNEGPNVHCGRGDTPIAEVVRMVRDNQWPISMVVEVEHDSTAVLEEVRDCHAQARGFLATDSSENREG